VAIRCRSAPIRQGGTDVLVISRSESAGFLGHTSAALRFGGPLAVRCGKRDGRRYDGGAAIERNWLRRLPICKGLGRPMRSVGAAWAGPRESRIQPGESS